MNNITRRIAVGAALVAAPVVIALGAAAASYADDSAVTNTGPVIITAPVEHPAFPIQDTVPAPGSVEHHHHQWNHG